MMAVTLPGVCPMAAFTLLTTSSEAVLSAKRPAAVSALTAGWTAWSLAFESALGALTEYVGSTKAKSVGFETFPAWAGAGSTTAALVDADVADGAVWRWAATASWIVRMKLPFEPVTSSWRRLSARFPLVK